MENQKDLFSIEVGNKEGMKSLPAKPVVVVGKVAEPVLGKKDGKKAGKEVGKKLVIMAKHPDREEPIKISSMLFISGKTLKSSTIWINIDEDGNIEKGSQVAILLEKYQAKTLNDLEGKTLQTELDENKFLAIRCY